MQIELRVSCASTPGRMEMTELRMRLLAWSGAVKISMKMLH